MTKKELAIENHNKGYNCCQAVACAFSNEIGMDESILFKACEGFGLGMGCTECFLSILCGKTICQLLKTWIIKKFHRKSFHKRFASQSFQNSIVI